MKFQASFVLFAFGTFTLTNALPAEEERQHVYVFGDSHSDAGLASYNQGLFTATTKAKA
eukprot:Pgem_evm1s15474